MKRQLLQRTNPRGGVVASLHLSSVEWHAALSRLVAAPARTSHFSARQALLVALFLLVINLSSTAYFLVGQYRELGGTYFLIDDAWIHLRFAKNLADGFGFSFNPGHPIAASTAPLWTVIMAVSYKATGELILSTYLWGIVLSAATCFLAYRLALLITDRPFLAVASAVVVSLCPWLTWSALSGMEIMLSAALILTTLLLQLRYQDDRTWKGYLGVGAAGLATLARPEAYVLFLALVIHRVARGFLSVPENRRHAITVWLPRAALVCTLIVLPYGLFSLKTAGSFFPNTYSAKVGDLGLLGAIESGSAHAIALALFVNPWHYLGDFTQAVAMINTVLAIVLPFGMLGLLRRDTFLLPLYLILFPLLVGMVIPTDRISWPWYRHMLNLIPVFVIVSLAGSNSLLEKVLSRAPKWATPVRRGLVGILIIAVGLLVLVGQPKVRESFISRGAAMKTEHIAIADWINQHVPPQAVIAASDIGVIGFYTQNFVIDTEGLITPEILGEHRRNGPAKDQEVYQYLAKTRPDYLVKFHKVYSTFPEAEFTPIYKSGKLVVYRTPWTRY
jgi:arabinofuranosyltransferase